MQNEALIDSLVAQAEALLAKWFTRPALTFNPESKQLVRWCMLDFILVLRRHLYELCPDRLLRLDACLVVIAQIVDVVEEFAVSGGLGVMQDTALFMCSSLGSFLHQVRGSTRPTLIDLPQRFGHAEAVDHKFVETRLGKLSTTGE